ncbi:MAG: ComF protein [Parcubacteria group bacterium Gr01-1014_8]|nr:MAG: ComF protein [Parcubacteria group bacterium Gr01-1014_8]
MMRFFRAIFDAILPQKARVARTQTYTLKDLELSPTTHEAYGVQITTLMSYRTKAVEDLIRALKYDGAKHASHALAEALGEYLQEEIAHIKLFSSKSVLLVPISLHSERLRERGFNQIEVVLNALPEEFKNGKLTTLSPRTLTRIRNTPQQTRLSRNERLKNVEGAFAVSDEKTLQDTHVILIDDVTTTGATLSSAAQTLKKTGVSFSMIALARA